MGLRRHQDVSYEVIDGRAMLVDTRGVELITLNPVGTLVWELLDGSRDLAGVARCVHERFTDVDEAVVTGDVVRFVEELCALGLAEDGHAYG